MRRFALFILFTLVVGACSIVPARAEPSDKYSLAHSTFIGTGETWTGNVFSTMTVRQGDTLAYVTVVSTATGGLVTIFDGVDTGGALRAEVETHETGYFPFEVLFTSSSRSITVSKTGAARVNLTFYVTHPILEE